jgi:hypothetical protein
VDANGEHDPVRVTFTDGFDGLPSFSPDGQRLCWTANRTSEGSSQLFLADWNHRAALAALESAPKRAHASTESPHAELTTRPVQRGEALPIPSSSDINARDLEAEVGYLASDALEGRMTGSHGSQLASEYIASTLRQAGLEPIATNGSFFQEFHYTSGVDVVTNENQLVVWRDDAPEKVMSFVAGKDFRPLALTANDQVEGEVVFAGYGLSIPGKPGDSTSPTKLLWCSVTFPRTSNPNVARN